VPLGVAKRCNELAKSFDQEAVYDTNVGVVCSHGAVMVQSWCNHGAVHTGVVALALQLEASAES